MKNTLNCEITSFKFIIDQNLHIHINVTSSYTSYTSITMITLSQNTFLGAGCTFCVLGPSSWTCYGSHSDQSCAAPLWHSSQDLLLFQTSLPLVAHSVWGIRQSLQGQCQDYMGSEQLLGVLFSAWFLSLFAKSGWVRCHDAKCHFQADAAAYGVWHS